MPCTLGQKRKTIKSQQRLKTEALQQAAGTLLGLGKQLQTHLMLPLIRVTAVHANTDLILPNWFCEFFAELAWSKGISFGWNNSVCNVSSPGLNEYGAASLALHNYSPSWIPVGYWRPELVSVACLVLCCHAELYLLIAAAQES